MRRERQIWITLDNAGNCNHAHTAADAGCKRAEITSVDVAGKTCLRVQATGHQKPYFAHGRAYIRVADEDRQMSARELESLILKRNSAALRWDNEPCNTPLTELSEYKIRRFVERAGLPWDCVLSAEVFRAYKPDPRTYLGVAQTFDAAPAEVMLVAAHQDDLAAARACGLRTAYIERPYELGRAHPKDGSPQPGNDLHAKDLNDLARMLGC